MYLLVCVGFNFICSKFEFFPPLFYYFWLDFWHCVDWGDWFTCYDGLNWFRFKFTKILHWFACYNCCGLNEIQSVILCSGLSGCLSAEWIELIQNIILLCEILSSHIIMIRNFQINHASWYVTLRKVIDNTLYQLCGWCRHLEYDF